MPSINVASASLKDLRVSVIIPAFNAAHFLPETIASVRHQTRPVHEIIIIDDGSKDDTEQIVGTLGKDIVYIKQNNAGVSAARNRGISEASGEFIALLDADDLWLPNKIEKQLQVFIDHPDVALVATDRADIDAQGARLLDSLFKQRGLHDFLSKLANTPIPQALSRLVQLNFIPTSSVMLRNSALTEVGGFDPSIRYGEDLDLWARMALRHAIVCIPEVLIHYRLHGNNATQATENLLLDLVHVMKNIRTRCAETLNKEGINANKLVAQSLWDLGYWYFISNQPFRAYKAFMESYKDNHSLRTLSYALISLLPPGVLGILRRIKQKITN